MSWTEVPIGEVVSLQQGMAFNKKNNHLMVEDGVPLLRITDLINGTESKFVDREKVPKRFISKPSDIIYTRTGQVGLVFKGRVGVAHNNCFRVIPIPCVDPEYLYQYLRQTSFRSHALQLASGAAQPDLNHDAFKSIPIKYPSLPTQKRIAAILSAYDDLIENNTRRIAILEEMARRLYEEWFVHFRFPGHEEMEFVETDLGSAPHEWQVQTIAETFEITGGGTPSKKMDEYWAYGTIEWFSPTDLTRAKTTFMDGSSSNITPLGLRKSSARLFPPFSVMLTSRATIGAIAINTTEACTNQGFITCQPNKSFPLYLLLHWLRDNVEMFISLASGATFKEISKGVFKEIKLLVPPQRMSDDFERMVGPLMQQVLILQRKNSNLRAQRDLLLPKLVSREIDVSAAEAALEAAE